MKNRKLREKRKRRDLYTLNCLKIKLNLGLKNFFEQLNSKL